MGHYNATEELETELTFSSLENERVTPYGMSLDPSLCSGVAFDNFDRYVETDTGNDTGTESPQDTVGIACQDLSPITQEILEASYPSEINGENAAVSRKSRTFGSGSSDLEPYYKKTKMRFVIFFYHLMSEEKQYLTD